MNSLGKLLAVACGTVTIAALSTLGQSSAADISNLAPAVDGVFQRLNNLDDPGCVVGVEQKGSPPLIRSYGSADLEHGVPIDASTVFEAGSVSKQFTAASVLLLVGQGKLALSDDVRKYIAELPDYGAPITINELLTHTSGLRDWSNVESMAGWPRTTRVYTMPDVLDIAARQKSLNYRPGTFFSYTNTGYDLLALVVERVSHESLPQFSREHLFLPLGMSHTQWRDNFRRVVKNRAIAYYDFGKEGYMQVMPFENTYGHAGLLTTVGDLLIWNEALSSGALGQSITAQMEQQTTLSDGRRVAYARGLYVETYDGMPEIAHPGVTAGYKAWLGRYPEAHLSIALLCNNGDVNTTRLARSVADLFLPKQETPAAATIDADQLKQHAGLYVDSRRQLPLRLVLRGNELRLSPGPMLVPISPTEFRADSTIVRFDGADRVVTETKDGDVLEYQRVQPWRPTPAEMANFAGTFRSDEALATYHVRVTDAHIVATPQDSRAAELSLEPIFSDTFMASGLYDDFVIHFTRDQSGGVSGFEMRDPRVYGLSFHRIPDKAY